MKKRSFIQLLIFFIVLISINILRILYYSNYDKTIINEDVEINKKIEILNYPKNEDIYISSKKDFSNVKYIDLVENGFTDKKANDILDYLDFVGSIQNFEELKNIPRFSVKDIEKIKEYFYINEENYFPKKHNINELNELELSYLGISKKEREKIIKKIKKTKILNEEELLNIISQKTYDKIYNKIYFE